MEATDVRDVRVPYGGGEIGAILATPVEVGRFPAVVVIHEWWGLNDHIRDVTGRLASEGIVAVAPDLYDGRITADPEAAGSMMMGLDAAEALAKLSATVEFAGKDERSSGEETGVIGFCMGGSYSLLLAIHDERIHAAAPFYGQVPGDDVLSGLSRPVFYVYAGKDQWITKDEVDRLDRHLEGKTGEVARFMDADHAFFNNTRPEVYRPEDAKNAWDRVVGFLKENLG